MVSHAKISKSMLPCPNSIVFKKAFARHTVDACVKSPAHHRPRRRSDPLPCSTTSVPSEPCPNGSRPSTLRTVTPPHERIPPLPISFQRLRRNFENAITVASTVTMRSCAPPSPRNTPLPSSTTWLGHVRLHRVPRDLLHRPHIPHP